LSGQAAVPAGLPASVVARRLVQGNRSGDDSELYTLYQFGDRLVLRNEAPPMSRAYSLLADFQVDGGCLVSEGDGGPARWVTVEQATESLASLNGPGPWVLQSSRRTIWIERVAAPKSTLEWSRNRSGLWARVPWPTGTMDLRQIAEPVVPGKRHWQGADRFEIPIFAPGLSDAGFDRFGLFVSWRFYSVEQCFRYIEPGTFLMGSPEAEPERDTDEGPQHEVTLTQGFWLADTACTQALWTAVMGSNPSHFTGSGDQCPVEQVSWDDVREFLSRIQKLLPGGCEAVMPTEAEWEYACRAGTPTPFSFGELIDPTIVNYDGNFPYAGGEKGEYREKTVPVNSLAPNPWGLYEMHGNVYEWCADHLGAYSAEPQIDPRGADRLGALRAIRGGSWIDVARGARSAYRGALGPGLRLHYLGFRFALRSQEPGRGAQQQGLAAETRRGSPVSAAEPPPGARALPAEPVELPLSAAEPPEFFERPEPEPDPAPGLLDRLKSLTRRRPKTPPKGKR
jgi:formylglycine-generating enzyme required for sulfatase activity